MVDAEEYERWRSEASRALEGAGAQADRDLYNWACFSSEQAAKLALKGLLHGIGRGPWGHDLDRLIETAREAGVAIGDEAASAGHRLGRHYIPARYPDAHAAGNPGRHYDEADWRQALRDSQAIIQIVDEAWDALQGKRFSPRAEEINWN